MARTVALVAFVLVILVGLYLAWGSLGTAASVVQVADGLLASPEKNRILSR